MVWRVPFTAGKREFLAVGGQRNNLKVWEIDDDLLLETRMRFPDFTRFFYDPTVGEFTRVDRDKALDGYTLVRLRSEE